MTFRFSEPRPPAYQGWLLPPDAAQEPEYLTCSLADLDRSRIAARDRRLTFKRDDLVGNRLRKAVHVEWIWRAFQEVVP